MEETNKQHENEPTLLNKMTGYFVMACIVFLVIYIPVQIFKGKKADDVREEKRQARIEILKKFDEISVERDAPYKMSVNILLKKELTETELQEIAKLIYSNKTGESYRRVFITCYLHGTMWATAHFNPNLEVKINDF